MGCRNRTPPPKAATSPNREHGPDDVYGGGGEDWFGFKGVRALGDREPDI